MHLYAKMLNHWLCLALLFVLAFPFASVAQPSPVMVRIKNNSNAAIKDIEIINNLAYSYHFSNIAAGQVSPYMKLSCLCAYNYQMKILYALGSGNKAIADRDSVSDDACEHYYKGKLLITINTKFKQNHPVASLDFKRE